MKPEIDFPGVADEAASGAKIIVCVCPDAEAVSVGVDAVDLQWQMRTGQAAQQILFDDLLARRIDANEPPSLVLVQDAWRGASDEDVKKNWGRLNSLREAIRSDLTQLSASLILFMTESVFRLIAQSDCAVDLLGLVQIERADDESPAIEQNEEDLICEYKAVLGLMESRYQLDTETFLQRLLSREVGDEITDEDRNRWSDAISMLRKVQ